MARKYRVLLDEGTTLILAGPRETLTSRVKRGMREQVFPSARIVSVTLATPRWDSLMQAMSDRLVSVQPVGVQ